MVTFSSVACSEEQGSPEDSVTERGLEASVTLRCAWADRYNLFEDVLFTEYPHLPGCGAVAYTGSIVPAGKMAGNGQGGVYEQALVRVNYIQPEWAEITATEVATESIEPSAEFITLKHSEFEWVTGEDPDEERTLLTPEEAPGRLVVGFDYVQTRYRLTSVPLTVLSEIGKVNSTAVTATYLGLTFAADTLLFASSNPRRAISTFTLPKWDVTCRYSFRPGGWNKYWRSKTGQYENIYVKDSETPYFSYEQTPSLPLV